MTRNEFMVDLAVMIRPRAALAAAKQLEKMLDYLVEIPDHAFTVEMLPIVAKRLKRSPNLGELRDALNAAIAPPSETQDQQVASGELRNAPSWLAAIRGNSQQLQAEWEDRQRELREDWGAPGNVRHAVAICDGDRRLLDITRGLVQRWAPHNVDLIPPPA